MRSYLIENKSVTSTKSIIEHQLTQYPHGTAYSTAASDVINLANDLTCALTMNWPTISFRVFVLRPFSSHILLLYSLVRPLPALREDSGHR